MNDVIQLSELGEIITGNTPSTSDNANYESDDILFVKPSDISNDRISYIENTENYISNYAKEQARVVPSDTVFCTCIGIIGKVGIATKDSAFNQQINAIIPDKNKVTSDYLAYALMAKRNYMQVKANAAVVPIINKSQFAELKIKYVSLEEQRCITDKFQLIDSLIAKREKQIETIEYLVKSRFVEMFGDLRINPCGWKIQSFADLTDLITDGEHATPRRVPKGIYLLSARNVLNHSIQLDDVDYIDEEEYKRIAKRVVPKEGDVLISCSGSVGRCCSVPAGLKFQMVRSAALLRFKSFINPVFAEYMITSDYLQGQINSAKTASSQANLFQGRIAKLKGFAPPIDLQKNFADFVAHADKSKLAVRQSIETLQTLKAKLMQDYFG